MDTSAQYYRCDHKLTACALGEPSLTLVRADSGFGLLIASSAHEDSFTSRLHLDEVFHLSIVGERYVYTPFDSVSIYRELDTSFAQDSATGRFFPFPSPRPYQVIFIPEDVHRRIAWYRAEDLAFPVFEIAQRLFGDLPGFEMSPRLLTTPPDYATRCDAVPSSRYVHPIFTATGGPRL
jgi:hypothetical protein